MFPVQIPKITHTGPGETSDTLTWARFRFRSNDAAISPHGAASDGEVEDYQVRLFNNAEDFGDAPAPYPTLLIYNGPKHEFVSGLMLGEKWDAEMDGSPGDRMAGGDDSAGAAVDGKTVDDEDGVIFLTPLAKGKQVTVRVKVTGSGVIFTAGLITIAMDCGTRTRSLLLLTSIAEQPIR